MADIETERGLLSLRAIAMPKDTNPSGDMFGGWLMSQMDLAAGWHARYRARGRVATVAVEGMVFHKPVYVGDEVSCYTRIEKVGRTSITVSVESWVRRMKEDGNPPTDELVTRGLFTMVALDKTGKPTPVPKEDKPADDKQGDIA